MHRLSRWSVHALCWILKLHLLCSWDVFTWSGLFVLGFTGRVLPIHLGWNHTPVLREWNLFSPRVNNLHGVCCWNIQRQGISNLLEQLSSGLLQLGMLTLCSMSLGSVLVKFRAVELHVMCSGDVLGLRV